MGHPMALRFQHSVLCHEILAGMGNQLGVARVIHGFHANNLLYKVVIVRVDMLDQFELGVSGPNNQYLRSALHRFHDLMIVVLVFGLTAAADRTPLALQVARRVGGLNHRFLNVIGADVDDMGFVVIKPDDGMVMRHGLPFLVRE